MMLHLFCARGRQVAMKAAQSGILAFKKVAAMGWDDGVSLDELLARVNRVAAKLLPAEEDGDSRISPTFLPRTFRHYVTLGCIDAGRREGRHVVYYYRHFLQALLLRRLLSERVPARRMPEIMAGRSNEETERMLLGGVEIVSRPGAGSVPAELTVGGGAAVWKRIGVAPGVELHLRENLSKPKPSALKELLVRLESALRGNF